MLAQQLTLCLIQDKKRLLLGLKKRGFGVGKWNGFGGNVQAGESIERATARELMEESGLRLEQAEKRGLLQFEFEHDVPPLEIHVFAVTHYTGEPQETEEMMPQWFELANIPYTKMWADDRYWLPLFLAGNYFTGHFVFQDTETLLEHEVTPSVSLTHI